LRLQHLGRPGHLRKTGRLADALLDDLPRAIEVGALFEDHVHRRQTGHRLRLDVVQPRDSIEEVLLERHRDQLLHLLGREAQRLGLDVDGDRGELRQHVGLRAAEGPDAEHHDHHGDGHDSPTSLEARPDDPTHHWREPPCEWWAGSWGTSALSAC
jgi:hypothetical protein